MDSPSQGTRRDPRVIRFSAKGIVKEVSVNGEVGRTRGFLPEGTDLDRLRETLEAAGTLAPQSRLREILPEIFDDFLEHAVGYKRPIDRAFFIKIGATDHSSLDHFATDLCMEEIKRNILERYGIDVDTLPDLRACTVLEAIQTHRN